MLAATFVWNQALYAVSGFPLEAFRTGSRVLVPVVSRRCPSFDKSSRSTRIEAFSPETTTRVILTPFARSPDIVTPPVKHKYNALVRTRQSQNTT